MSDEKEPALKISKGRAFHTEKQQMPSCQVGRSLAGRRALL